MRSKGKTERNYGCANIIEIVKQENKKYHGFGTKSIAYIVKKYDGKMHYETEDNIFKLKIAI